MGAWDIETGRKAFFVLDAHDGEEITAVAIDRPCKKIATGARNGVIKVESFVWGEPLSFKIHFCVWKRFGIVPMDKIFMCYRVLKMRRSLEYFFRIKV